MKTNVLIKGWTLIGVLMALVPMTACVRTIKAAKPVWAVTGQYQKYTTDKYIIGVGSGPSQLQAKHKAKLAISSQLQKRLTAELKVRGAKLTLAGRPTLDTSLAPKLLASLPQPKEVLTWTSKRGDDHFSMVVIERSKLSEPARAQVNQLDKKSMELVGFSSAAVSEDPYIGLLNLIAAASLHIRAEQYRALLAAVDLSQPPGQKGPSLAELVSRIEDLLGRVRLMATHGKNLSLNANAKEAVLVLSADFATGQTRIPFSGCPIKFESKRLDAIATRVNVAGMASASLQDLSRFAGKNIIVDAHIDGSAVVANASVPADDARFEGLRQMLSSKSASFHLRIMDKNAKTIALAVAETRGGELRQNSHLVSVLQQELTKKAYNCLTFEQLQVQLPAEPNPKTMSEAFNGKADLLIYGVAATSLERKVSAGLVFVKTNAQVVLLDLASGKVLWQKNLSARSPGMDLASASTRALGSIARKILASIKEQGALDR